MVRYRPIWAATLLALISFPACAAGEVTTPWIWGLPVPNAGGEGGHMHSPLGEDIASAISTARGRVEPRQQEVMTEACIPETAYIAQASCIPFVADQTSYICGTTTSSTVGCGVNNATQSVTVMSPVLSGRCAQTGCATCAADNNVAPTTHTIDCKNCTTVNGTIWGPPLTAFPSGTPPHGSRAPAAQVSGHDIKNDASDTLPRDILKLVTRTFNVVKRSLMTPQDYPGGHDGFMMQQVAQANVAGVLVPHRPPGTDGRSSARVDGFRQLGLSIAVQGLNGCTSIAIVSRKGAWLSHIWEIPTFQNDQLFVEDVLYGIFEGDDSGYFPGINDHSHDASLFNTLTFGQTQNFVIPLIITPRIDADFWGDPKRPWRFMHDIQKVKDMLHNMFGVEPIVYAYDLLENLSNEEVRQKLDRSAHGKVVIQYDPHQYLPVEPFTDNNGQVRGSCIRQYAAVRVYADTNPIPIWEDTWVAIPEQAILPNNMQQVLVRDETSGNITGYGCITELTNSTCSYCTAGNSCGINPDDDQGQDGTPPEGDSCSLCASTGQCDVNPDDDQGQDGPPPSSNFTDVCKMTTMPAPTSSACTLTTMPAVMAPNGQPYSFRPTSCNCAGSLQPTTTAKGTDGTMTPLCAADLPKISCACMNGGLVPLVITTASNGDQVMGCDQNSTTVALRTSSKTAEISNCSTTVLAFNSTKCACPAGITAELSTATGVDYEETYFCAGPSESGSIQPVGTANTTSLPMITECSLTRIANGTKPGFTPAITQYATACACNHNRTVSASASFTQGSSMIWYCPTGTLGKTGSAIAAITVPSMTAPQTAAPSVTSCDLITKPASSAAAATRNGTTYAPQSYPEHTVCTCNGLGEVAYNTVTATDGAVKGECQLPAHGTTTAGFVVSTLAKPPPTSCSPFLAITPPGRGSSQAGWQPRTFCDCDHDRTLAWNAVTATNGDVVRGCGYGVTDVVVPVATQTATVAGPYTHTFLILDVLEKASSGINYYWSGVTMPISNNMDICNGSKGTQSLIKTAKPDYRPFPYPRPFPYFPTELKPFDLVGHTSCVYSGPSSTTAGNITCGNGYVAYCTAASSAGGGDRAESDCGNKGNNYKAAVECPYHDTTVAEKSPHIAEVTDPAPQETGVFEIFRGFARQIGGIILLTYWMGGIRNPGNRAACNKPPLVFETASETFMGYYPEKLDFSLDGRGKCSYTAKNNVLVGSITCADGYRAVCTVFADDSKGYCNGLGTDDQPYYPLFYCRVGAPPTKTASTVATLT